MNQDDPILSKITEDAMKLPMETITFPTFTKDIELLRKYDYDIRDIFLKNAFEEEAFQSKLNEAHNGGKKH